MALSAVSRRLSQRLVGAAQACAVQYLHTGAAVREPAHPKPVPLAKMKDSFLDGTSSTYLEELEERFRRDPGSVDRTWAAFFSSLDQGVPAEAVAEAYHQFEAGMTTSPFTTAALSQQTAQESMKLMLLVRAYEVLGHYHAQLDPLGLDKRKGVPELDPAYYGFTDNDMDREFFLGTFGLSGFLSDQRPTRTLREVLRRLRETYCGAIGFEYMHIPDRERCNWLRDRIETIEKDEFPKERKLHLLDRLAWSEMFESFLANKYTAAKRFGLEGAESLIPGMKALIDRAADLGVNSVVMGMPHRGRLNVLANVVRKPMTQIFGEFSGAQPAKTKAGDEWAGSGDVKYHLGTSYDRPTISGRRVHLSLLANPSHLEAVNTVVLGKVRAKQFYADDRDRTTSMGLLLHGDGAFSGQGIVYETLDLSCLPDYTTGGTIHIVVNNQVAFTTDPKESRSSPYCTDVAKALDAPIFHVNGDDAEAVVRVFELAAEWRQAWKTDVVIDLVCYRKYGHNEIDEPMFTQPLMYSKIKAHKNCFEKYKQELLDEGSATKEELREVTDRVQNILHKDYEAAKDYEPHPSDWLSSHWDGFLSPAQKARIRNTGVPMELLKHVGETITALPPDFNAHKQIRKVYEHRRTMVDSGEGVDWAMAEALAFGTLISEGFHVRLSGQDVERGTFSHRHSVLHDQKSGEKYVPLDHVYPGQKHNFFTVSNSSLSEFGVLGFELGYCIENPNSLVIWEAQFGDFANGAQVIFDQFVSSGEAKWLRQSGLVCLLPHGYDGQGPEHSSARLERFLQMCDENPYKMPSIDESKWFTGGHLGSQIQRCNWQVANVTTPANYFHLLRRQIHRQFRKPLVVMAPKNLLRHPACKSGLWEFDDVPDDKNIVGVRFKRVIMDDGATDRSPHPEPDTDKKRVVFCSGKLYYELEAERKKRGQQGEVAIVRVEQLAPFPFDLIMREMRRYPGADYVWAQEEPWNMGAYSFIKPRFETCLRELDRPVPTPLPYAGRPPMASTATGYGQVHAAEQAALIGQALDIDFKGLHTLP